MRVLMIAPQIPMPSSGAGTRNYHLLKAIAGQHRVSLLALNDDTSAHMSSALTRLQPIVDHIQIIPFAIPSKRRRQFLNALQLRAYASSAYRINQMQRAIDTLLAQQHYDVVLFESALMATYPLPAGIKVIIDQHNIEYELRLRIAQQEKTPGRKWYNWLEGHLLKPTEIRRCKRANAVFVTSERERDLLDALLPDRMVKVVPNGVDIEVFRYSQPEQTVANRLIFTGSLSYYPNAHALRHFALHCWPRIRAEIPTATWHIVGKHPLPEVRALSELPGVTVIGTVPEVQPYLQEAQVAIVPLHIGSGTRLKILEAFAMGKAVVSTSLGCEGLSVVPEKHLVVADTVEAFAREVVALLREPERRRRLGENARQCVEAHYSWQLCTEPVLCTLAQLDPGKER